MQARALSGAATLRQDPLRTVQQGLQPGELVLMPSIGGGYLMGCAGFIAEPALCEQGPIPEERATADATA